MTARKINRGTTIALCNVRSVVFNNQNADIIQVDERGLSHLTEYGVLTGNAP
jgi:hypothetical protein